jgi:TolB-like protein/lipoprotein NlpI
MGIVSELRRRNVFRMAVLYAIAAWLIMQVAEVLNDLANLPDWVGPTILGLLAVGFPIALILSWFYQITPEGISPEKDVDRAESITQLTGRRLDFIVISLLCAAVILFAYDKWWIGGPPRQSIAVLPFENMSDDVNNEYFSDGISEELLNLLTKVPELRVISRTSAFSYKGKDIDIPTIAAQLNVAHVLEGSVRKAGNQVRISAQLIEASSDSHLWSETYERTLDDIFATQDEIAARVVEQLKLALLGDAPTVQATEPEAFALVLQARYLRRQFTPDTLKKSIALSEQALAIDPDYAAAWAGLASGYTRQASQGLRPFDEGYTLAREAASQALALDPAYAPAHRILAQIATDYDRDLVAAARHYERALALEPTNSDSISNAADTAASLGRLDQAIALAEYTAAHDPVAPSGYANLGLYYRFAGRLDEAIASFRSTLTLSPGYIGAQYLIGEALLLKGEPESALAIVRNEASEVHRVMGLVMAHHALGQAAASDAALATLIEKYEKEWAYNIAYVLAFRGEADRAFEWLNQAVAYNDPGLAYIATEPLFANIHVGPRWLSFLESIGKSPKQLAAIEFKVTLPE